MVGRRGQADSSTEEVATSKRRPWVVRHKIFSLAASAVLVIIIIASITSSPGTSVKTSSSATPTTASAPISPTTTPAPTAATTAVTPTTSTTSTTVAPTTTTVPTRVVTGKAVTLGAGQFAGGTDVTPGLYDVTTTSGQSGNFIVEGPDTYDEILGTSASLGVPKVRARISKGDSIQISGMSNVIFTPVTAPLVTTHTPVTLYAGTWTVGQDIGAGRYVATTTAGSSGNFIIVNEFVDEILGQADGLGVPSITVNLHKGDVIDISSLSTVTMTPAGP